MPCSAKVMLCFFLLTLSLHALQLQCDDSALTRAEKLREERPQNFAAMALSLYQQALACPVSDDRKAEILMNIGRMQTFLDRSQEAITSFHSSLALLQSMPDQSREVQKMEASDLVNLGRLLHDTGEIEQAMSSYAAAWKLFKELDDKSGEAYSLQELARASYLMGDNEAALKDYSQALDLRNAISSDDLRNQEFKAALLDEIGRVYAHTGKDELAESRFHDALDLARKVNYHFFIALTLNDAGILLLKQNKPQEAEKNHQEALLEFQQYYPENREGIAETYALWGDAQRQMGRYDLAHDHYQEALELQQQSGDVIGEAQTRYSLGLLESASNHPQDALDALTRSADLYRRMYHREGESQVRFQMATVLLAQNDHEGAKKQVAEAIELAEQVRALTPGRALRSGYFASVQKMYRFEIDFLLANEGTIPAVDQLLALDLLQRSQARTLVDSLEFRTSARIVPIDDATNARREDLLRKWKTQNATLQSLLQRRPDVRQINAAFQAVQQTEISIDQLEAEAQNRQPVLGFFSGKRSNDKFQQLIKQVQQQIVDGQSVLIQFYLSEPHSYAWIITPSEVNLVQLAPGPALEKDVRAILHFGAGNAWTPSQQVAVAELRKKFAPVFAAAQAKRWIVVADGELHNLPFSLFTAFPASRSASGPEEIVKIPSITAIAIVRKQKREIRPVYTLAAFADPVFNARDSRVRGNNSSKMLPMSGMEEHTRGGSFPRLIYSRDEIRLILKFVPPRKYKLFEDFAASADAASEDHLKDFRIIHFSTHSITDAARPELSTIVFSLVSRNGKPKNPGYLMLKDIYRMNLSADLVVLSSCRAAVGGQQSGEGPMSLSRAFLFAGSKAVVAPLWEVDDEASAKLMGSFYQYMLHDRLDPDRALKKAQDDLRRDPTLRNPFYWAGFEVHGDWAAH
jgi:tetratricopeptide (TPR) repeat protein